MRAKHLVTGGLVVVALVAIFLLLASSPAQAPPPAPAGTLPFKTPPVTPVLPSAPSPAVPAPPRPPSPSPVATPPATPERPDADRAPPIVVPLSSVRGRVIDAEGRPVAGANVTLSSSTPGGTPLTKLREVAARLSTVAIERRAEHQRALESGLVPVELGTTRSAADGSFAIKPTSALRADAILTVSAAGDRDGRRAGQRDVAFGPEVSDLDAGDLVIQRVTSIPILVRSRGTGLPGASVRAREVRSDSVSMAGHSPLLPLALTTDARGEVRLDTTADNVFVVVEARGFARQARNHQVHPAASATFDLEPDAGISGRVLGPDGRPLAGVTVFVSDAFGYEDERDAEVVTGQDGRFELAGFTPGREVTLVARGESPRLVEASRSVTPPATNADLRVEGGGSVAVEVRLPSTCSRRASPEVALQRRDEKGHWRRDTTVVPGSPDHKLGLQRFASVRRGTVRVVARAPGVAPAASEPLEVIEDRETRVTLTLAPGRTVTGRVLTPRGDGVRGARVSTTDPDREVHATTSADGRFTLEHVPSDASRVRIDVPDLDLVEVPLGPGVAALQDVVVGAK